MQTCGIAVHEGSVLIILKNVVHMLVGLKMTVNIPRSDISSRARQSRWPGRQNKLVGGPLEMTVGGPKGPPQTSIL